MSEFRFEALARDAVNAANSLSTVDDSSGEVKQAVAGVLAWLDDDFADHLLEVVATKDANGASVIVTVKERNVYVPAPFAVPASVSAPHDTPPVEDAPVDAPAPADVPADDAPASDAPVEAAVETASPGAAEVAPGESEPSAA